MEKNKKIDVIIPAYKAHNTIFRAVSSIACQTIVDDIEVTIVNDACPEGNYKKVIDTFSPYMKIKEIKLAKNGGPGVARQYGIDNTSNEFFTCMDADDTFNGTLALEILRTGITQNEVIKCVSGTFLQMGDDLQHILPHQNDMVWMFGKLYRREFIEKYKIHFNETRANEDTGFNKWVQLLCSNPNEQILFINEPVYYWHLKKNSITRINDGQYGYDQCYCGWVDNMIYAIQNAKKQRPFDGGVLQMSASVMMQIYFYYIEIYAKHRPFAKQAWEYAKKFYDTCYKKWEEDVTEEALSELYSMCAMGKFHDGSMIGIIPHMGIKEFLDQLKNEEYHEDDIYDVWEEMKGDPDTFKLMMNNVECGVCKDGYMNRPHKAKEEKKPEETESK